MKTINKIFTIILFFFLFINNIFAIEIDTYSEKYFLYNISDNEIILEKNSSEKSYIASLTKIMTVITAIENIEDFNKKVKITNEMLKDIEWDVAVAGFKVGEKVTYDDLLYATMLASSADAANALAISISGNFEDFVKLMNKNVEKLNLENTHFANVVGLFDENNYSSAYDMAQILNYALKNKKFKQVFEAKEYRTTNNIKVKRTISRSSLNIDIIKGAKTGYIKAAGNCLASTATINDANLLLITLNAHTKEVSSPHIKDTIKIYNYVKDNYSYKDIISKEDVITKAKVKYTKEKEIDIHSSETIKKFLNNDFKKEDVKINYNHEKKLTHFTKKNYDLGKVTLIYNEKEISSFNLKYQEKTTFSIISLLLSKLIYIILTIVILKYINNIKKKKRKKRNIHKY